ncbi:MAG: peptidylprolyl isomerase [Candidatus Scalindua rubra]|uniref:Peptidyl-prolyl cis-trans isomerase n=1 Tax=Candidatus Scalindua rubra TaxID=1872076 RepID=A0A1E3XE15_9BACT|nr:MAG: peptidylprolyl isomerase [Candidatus Scalindua rubra]
MSQAKAGANVKVHYTASLKDGKMFYSSKEKEPAEFTIGEKKLIPGFENAVIGMTVGETKEVCIPPEDAFGNYNENQVVTIERSQLPSDIDPQVGVKLNTKTNDGKVSEVTITDITDKTVTLDANHPLAGKELILELELVAIN